MEAPLVTPLATQNLKDSKKMEFNINNEIYEFIVSYNENILLFKVNPLNSNINQYELYLTLDQLYKINKIFSSFETIDEIVNWINDSYNEKNCTLKKSENKLLIQFLNPLTKKNFDIILNSKEKDLKSRIENLEKIVFDLSEKVKKINLLEEKVKKLEEALETKKTKKYLFQQSNILNNNSDYELILNWLPKKLKKAELLFNTYTDGDSTETFIKKSNGKSPTLVVIETTKGRVFGGYTTQPWKGEITKDDNAFVFSLITKKKYPIKDPSKAVGVNDIGKSFSAVMFGWSSNAIVVYTGCLSRSDNYVSNYTYNISEIYELNGGESCFTVKSYELFHLQYE